MLTHVLDVRSTKRCKSQGVKTNKSKNLNFEIDIATSQCPVIQVNICAG